MYICAHKYRELILNDKMIFMKNVNYVINGVLGIAVVVLFILHFSEKKIAFTSPGTTSASLEEYAARLPVAYLDADTLLLNYYFSVDLTEQIVKEQEDAQAFLNQEEQKFQRELESFQYRYQNNAFTSQQRIDQEQQRLQRQQQELEALINKKNMELMEKGQRMTEQLRDTIYNHMKEYNQIKNYHIIFSNSSSNIVNPIMFADDSYNITDEVIEFLNKKWAPNK